MEPTRDDVLPSRRRVLLGTGTVLVTGLLAACGDDDGSDQPDDGQPTDQGPYGQGDGGGGDTAGGGTQPLTQVSEVPVGGAVAATTPDGKPVIVAQPTEGEIVAFSAICTHMGCTVAPGETEIRCPCHGSTYDLATGDNTGGPAPDPLPEVRVEVRDGSVVLA